MNEDNLHPWIDPELEARIVALILGEASDFEREELERLMAESAELTVFKQRIEAVHGMLHDTARGEAMDKGEVWKLSDERRNQVLATIAGKPEAAGDQTAGNAIESAAAPSGFPWSGLLKVAALIAILAVAGLFAMPAITLRDTRSYFTLASADTEAQSMKQTERARGWGRIFPLASEAPASAIVAEDFQRDFSYVDKSDRAVASTAPDPQSASRSLRSLEDTISADGFMTTVASGARPSDSSVDNQRYDHLAYQKAPAPAEGLEPNGVASFGSTGIAGGGGARDGAHPSGYRETRAKKSRKADAAEAAKAAKELQLTKEAPTDLAAVLEPATPALTVAGPTAAPAPTQKAAPAKSLGRENDKGRGAQVGNEQLGASAADKTPMLGDTPVLGRLFESKPGAKFQPAPQAESKAVAGTIVATSGVARNEPGELGQVTEAAPAATGLVDDLGSRGDRSGKSESLLATVPAIEEMEAPGSVDDAIIVGGAVDGESSRVTFSGKAVEKDDELGEAAGEDLYTKTFTVPPAFFGNTGGAVADPFASPEIIEFEGFIDYGNSITANPSVKEALEEKGIIFPPGASAFYNPETSKLVIRNTGANTELVETYVDSLQSMPEPPAPGPRPVPVDLNETLASEEPFSTFSLHVSDVSFKLAQASLAKGQWPDADRIRIEEFVNAFDYGDPMPGQRDKVACALEQSVHPFLQQRNLMRVSMRTAAAGRGASTPLRLTFLLDNSGSMERADRQETVRRAFALLADQLQPIDQVTLISFARQPRLLADRVTGDQSRELIDTVAALPSEGGTNLEAALELAFEKALEQQLESAQNRIILLTDGAANLGDASPESLAGLIDRARDSGIAFDAAGIGADGLNDEILEALTRKGDGRYYLLDRPEDADDGFARQIAGALRPAARNVKIQVEFNPKRVGRYKLLGFEKHRLEKEDFRNDAVDAAEMAAEEAGVAVYQFEPLPGGSGDVGSVSVRFEDMATGRMVEKRWPLPYEPKAAYLDEAAPSQRIAATAALFAARLKGDPAGEGADLAQLAGTLSSLPERHRNIERVRQLHEMIDQARQLAGE